MTPSELVFLLFLCTVMILAVIIMRGWFLLTCGLGAMVFVFWCIAFAQSIKLEHKQHTPRITKPAFLQTNLY